MLYSEIIIIAISTIKKNVNCKIDYNNIQLIHDFIINIEIPFIIFCIMPD